MVWNTLGHLKATEKEHRTTLERGWLSLLDAPIAQPDSIQRVNFRQDTEGTGIVPQPKLRRAHQTERKTQAENRKS